MKLVRFNPFYIKKLESWFEEDISGNQFITWYSDVNNWFSLVDNEKRFAFAVVEKRKFIGFVDIEITANNTASFGTGIDPKLRRRGHGSKLLKLIETHLLSSTTDKLFAGVDSNNLDCKRFLIKNGFKVVSDDGEITGYIKEIK